MGVITELELELETLRERSEFRGEIICKLQDELNILEREAEQNRRMINGLKLNNGKLTLERKELLDENMKLKEELARIKAMDMFEFANHYCTDEENAECGHRLARSLLGGK